MSDTNFKKWYHDKDNKQKLSDKRKDRYDKDPEYREKIKQRAKDYKRKKLKELGGAVMRKVNGVDVKVWGIGVIAKEAGVTTANISNMTNAGVIPVPSIYAARRVYTEHEKDLLIEFFSDPAINAGEFNQTDLDGWTSWFLSKW
jgi:hypothetical protein